MGLFLVLTQKSLIHEGGHLEVDPGGLVHSLHLLSDALQPCLTLAFPAQFSYRY